MWQALAEYWRDRHVLGVSVPSRFLKSKGIVGAMTLVGLIAPLTIWDVWWNILPRLISVSLTVFWA